MADPSLQFWIAASVAAMLVGLSKGGLPGIGVLGVPVLALVISPVLAAGLLLPIYVVTDAFGLWAYRHSFDRRNLIILIPAMALGVLIGWATASIVPEPMVRIIVGVTGVSFCLNTWLRHDPAGAARPADVPRGLFWGTIAGFTSFVSHAGGPPYQVYTLPQRMDKLVFAGTTTILFAIVNLLKLGPYWAIGQLSPANLEAALFLLPPAVAATFAGFWLVKTIPQQGFFRLVYGTLFLVSLKLIYDGLQA